MARTHLKIFTPQRGFSLIETLVVVGILSIIAVFALGSLRGVRSRAALSDGQILIVRALEEARNRAVTGAGTSDHGVHIEPGKIETFEGSVYIPGSGVESFLPPGVSTDQANAIVIFKRLVGQSSANPTIMLSNVSGATSTVAVTLDGAIIPSL
ncbi:MAG: type II secretion system protein [bacterium]|nr:type II secretion system protein [bacterium]